MKNTGKDQENEVLNNEDLCVLKNDLDLLLIIFHRNKNQHRGAIWWKHVCYLKQCLSRVIAIPNSVNLSQFGDRLPSIYTSFSTIIGTGQYVPLGMALLGILSRIWMVIGGPSIWETRAKYTQQSLISTRERELVDSEENEKENQDYGQVIPRENAKTLAVVAKEENSSILQSHRPIQGLTGSLASKSQEISRATLKTQGPSSKRHLMENSTASPRAKKQKQLKKNKSKTAKDEIDDIFG